MHASIRSLGRAFLPAMLVGLFLATVSRAALAQDVPYSGVIVDEKVDARAGASKTFYIVGTLTRGTKVTVAELLEGWLKIEPPQGVFSYISKAYVDAKGDGKTGVVNSEKPDKNKEINEVKAAAADPTDYSYKYQTQLNKGDLVQIVGEDGNNYKIVPPKGAYVFLPPGSVRRGEAAAVTPAPTPAPKPAPEKRPAPVEAVKTPEPEVKTAAPVTETPAPVPRVTEEAPTVAPEPTPAPRVEPKPALAPRVEAPAPPAPRTATADSTAVQALEARLAQAKKLPLTRQPLTELLAAYQSLSADSSLSYTDRRIVGIRIVQIKNNMEIASGLKELEEAKTAGGEKIDITPPKPSGPVAYSPSKYDLVGQLLASGVYNGETGPRLYRLVEPASMRTLAYVQSGRKFDPRESLGKIVGIVGSTRYDPALKLRVVDVQSLDVLEPATVPGASPRESSPVREKPAATQPSPTKETPATKPADEAKPAAPAPAETPEPMK